ncbi:protein rolling stone-like [Pectinophora gossypiella]|uniref:protein rolling stone-like n=1 Tax=Pectinophora gossypiella TaxID=13191 RepID=UPI00214F578D|nr:protein rolling stone-like [Pectinophora gossypiella]
MGAAGKYFKKQFQVSKFKLKHGDPTDFYLGCWQRDVAALPMLCLRAIIFLGCLAIILTSMVMTGLGMNFGFWFIYLTHWGLFMITLTSGFAFAVSWMAYTRGSIEATFDLPWYVKTYWALYNIGIPLAFFISIYYFTFLTGFEDVELAIDPVLDLFIHAINSVLMLLLLVTSRLPSRPLHFFYPVCFTLVYLIFTVFFYLADGRDPFDNNFIYPTLDWSEPGITTVMVVISAVALIVVHLVVVGLALARNALTRRFRQVVVISDITYSYN